MSVEELLGSRVRLKIIKILLEEEPLYLTVIARRAKVSTSNAKYHLEILEKASMVKSKIIFGGLRVYRLNHTNLLLPKLSPILN